MLRSCIRMVTVDVKGLMTVMIDLLKGVYMPEGENVKIMVAIKELSEKSNPGSDTELLEEARIMASVMHPCCIRIMAVCVTRQMMLITPLMQYGSLLDYMHRNRSNIGSRYMLTWAKQIAEVCIIVVQTVLKATINSYGKDKFHPPPGNRSVTTANTSQNIFSPQDRALFQVFCSFAQPV